MLSFYFRLTIICFLVTSTYLGNAQTGNYYLTNYSPKQYDASTQNWSIVQDNRGVLYIGNNDGIIEYDGIKWRLIRTKNKTVVRSLAITKKGRIYIGAKGEFGYLEPDSIGFLQFISLSNELSLEDQQFSDIWKCHAGNDEIYFQAFSRIFLLKDGKIKSWKPKTSFHLSFLVNGHFYINQKNIGLMELANNSLTLIPGGDEFAKDRIYTMLSQDENTILIGARKKGLFIYNSNQSTLEHIGDNSYLQRSKLYHGIRTNESSIALATISGGAILMNKEHQIISIINEKMKLQNEGVKIIFKDRENGLWLGLNKGLARVEAFSPLTYFDESSHGLKGSVYSINRKDNFLYVGTNQGMYYITTDTEQDRFNVVFKPIEGITSPTWALLRFKDKLLAASFEGVFEINKENAKKIAPYSCFSLFQSKSNQQRIFIGLRRGLASIQIVDEKWSDEGKLEGITEEIRTINEDDQPNLWLGTKYQGLIKVNLSHYAEYLDNSNEQLVSKMVEKYDESYGIPAKQSMHVYEINNKVVFSTDKGLFNYLPEQNSFAPDYTLGKEFSALKIVSDTTIENKVMRKIQDMNEDGFKTKLMYPMVEDENGNVWMRAGSHVGVALKNEKEYTWNNIPFLRMPENTLLSVYPDENNITWLGGSFGLVRYNGNVKKDYSVNYPAIIRKITIGKKKVIFGGTYYDDDKTSSLIQNQTMIPVLSYINNSVSFEYAAPFLDVEENNQFSYYLEGFDNEWSDWSTEFKKQYTNLHEGTYSFRVKAKNIYEHESSVSSYNFSILPPWYRTGWAYGGYFLLFIGFVYISIQLSIRRLQKAKIKLEKMVEERTATVVAQKSELEKQKDELDEKNQDIMASIRYAKRIQEAIMLPTDFIYSVLPNCFILYKPKDIVSGDFYYFSDVREKIVISAVDCTGHGVPGAFMSVIGNNLLNQIVNENRIMEADKILNKLHIGVRTALKQSDSKDSTKDGMDMSLCVIDKEKQNGITKVQFAGANNPLFLIRDGELTKYKGDKFPIGGEQREAERLFTNNHIEVKKGDSIYMFSDGFVDQFGGPKDKKFMTARFKELLLQINHKKMQEQYQILDDAIENWMKVGQTEQIDDICVIGIGF